MMNLNHFIFLGACFTLLSGCVASTGSVSLEDAALRAQQGAAVAPQEPEHSFAQLKDLFSDDPPAENCVQLIQEIDQSKQDAFARMRSGGAHSAIAEISWLSALEMKLGYEEKALTFAKNAYSFIPEGNSTRKAVLAFSITRLYAYQGDASSALSWFSKANSLINRQRKNREAPFGVANLNTANASLAYANQNLLAEEFFLKQARSTVWQERSNMKTSVNFEATLARLVDNLIMQGRYKEAEYTARTYLRRLKLYHKRMTYYPVLMHHLSVALFKQNKTNEALWAARRALDGHQKICSNPSGRNFTAAQNTLRDLLEGAP